MPEQISMMDLKPYPEYRDSGVPWLGKIPKHWEEKRAKYLLREVGERSIKGNELRLAMSQKLGLVPHTEIQERRLQSESYAGAKLCRINDIVMNRLKAHLGVFALVRQPGIVSPDYSVFRPVSSISSEYYEYLLKSATLRPELIRKAKGIIEGFWRLYTDDFYDIRLPVPPINEQEKIVALLRQENRKIDEYINSKRRFIDLLNEHKQVIISRAVMRGLDPNVRLKPSGIEWLGEVPEHWDIIRNKYIFCEIDLRSQTGCEELLSVSQYTGVIPRRMRENSENEKISRSDSFVGYKIVTHGNLVINIMLAWNGSLGVSQYEGIVSPAYCVYKILGKNHSQYFHSLLRTPLYLTRYYINSTGIIKSRLRLYTDDFYSIESLVPHYNEQIKISEYISRNTASIDSVIVQTQHEIDLLKEFRTRLIFEMVTGKLDIRSEKIADIQVPLPNESEMVPFNNDSINSEEDD